MPGFNHPRRRPSGVTLWNLAARHGLRVSATRGQLVLSRFGISVQAHAIDGHWRLGPVGHSPHNVEPVCAVGDEKALMEAASHRIDQDRHDQRAGLARGRPR